MARLMERVLTLRNAMVARSASVMSGEGGGAKREEEVDGERREARMPMMRCDGKARQQVPCSLVAKREGHRPPLKRWK